MNTFFQHARLDGRRPGVMKLSVRSWSLLLMVAAGLHGGSGVALGQSYPTKPVRLIIR